MASWMISRDDKYYRRLINTTMGGNKDHKKAHDDADVIIPLSRLDASIVELLDDDSELNYCLDDKIRCVIRDYFRECKESIEKGKKRRNRCKAETTYHDQDEEDEDDDADYDN